MDTDDYQDNAPITMITQRRVRPGREPEFEDALHDLIRASLEFPGQLGVHVLSPVDPHSREYAVIRKFANTQAQIAFYHSALYHSWQERVAPLVEGKPDIRELDGLESWFSVPASGQRPPRRTKMALLTLLGVYPTVLVLQALLSHLPATVPPWARTLLLDIILISLLTWVIMPRLTTYFRRWLYPWHRIPPPRTHPDVGNN